MIKIMPHIGLGDYIALTPLILKIADGGEAIVPCWKHNMVSVKSFFINHPNIHLLEVENEAQINDFYTKHGVIRMGVYNPSIPPLENEDYITWIHRQMGLSEIVYDDTLGTTSKEVRQNSFYKWDNDKVFMHHDRSRSFIIDMAKYGINLTTAGTPDKTNGSILSYADILKEAKEIHVIDSSFLHLAEALPTTGKLFFHKYARDGGGLSNYKFRKQWTIYA